MTAQADLRAIEGAPDAHVPRFGDQHQGNGDGCVVNEDDSGASGGG